MEHHKIEPPDGSQDGPGAAAGNGHPFHPSLQLPVKLQTNCTRYHAYQRGAGLSHWSRDGHHDTTCIKKNIPACASKHETVPSGSSGTIGKPRAAHHQWKHPHPMFPGIVQVTQACDVVWQEHSYAHTAANRDSSNHRGEHICSVKYDMCSKISSHSGDSQKHFFSHNSDGTWSDRIQHGQYCKSRISQLFPTRQPQPSAEGFVDCKPQAADTVHHMPILTDLTDYKHNVLNALDQKQNTAELHSLFGENRHESSNRRPVFSDSKYQSLHQCQSIKLESKRDINTVKKEDSMDTCNGAEASSAQPPCGNVSKVQGFFKANRWHRTSSSSSVPVLLPVINKSDVIGGYGNILCHSIMGVKLHDRVSDIIPPIQDCNNKDEICVAASVTGNNHNGSNTVMLSVSKEFETPDLIRSFSTKMSDSVSHTAILASTMEEQVQPLENAVSSACSSVCMSEHHHFSEEKKEKKEHGFRDMNQKESKHIPTHKDNGKNHHNRDKAVSSAPNKITIPNEKFIWKSKLDVTGLKMKIWRERIVTSQAAVQNQPHAKRKKKIVRKGRNLRAWLISEFPDLKRYSWNMGRNRTQRR